MKEVDVPNKPGATKKGEMKYMRKRDNPFFRFACLAPRSGVRNVVGL